MAHVGGSHAKDHEPENKGAEGKPMKVRQGAGFYPAAGQITVKHRGQEHSKTRSAHRKGMT